MEFLHLMTAPALLLLWRDLQSGRIYYSRYGQPPYFLQKRKAPIIYWGTLVLVGCLCLANIVFAGLLYFRFVARNENLELALSCGQAIPMLYLIYGLFGRFFSWLKNYGSVDHDW